VSLAGHYQHPGWFTTNLFNKLVGAMTGLGLSVYGSRMLEVQGRKSGEWRQTPVNLLRDQGSDYLVAHEVTRSGSRICVQVAPADCGLVGVRHRLPQRNSQTMRSHLCSVLFEEVKVRGRRILRRCRPRLLGGGPAPDRA